jgi:hypothetical protein
VDRWLKRRPDTKLGIAGGVVFDKSPPAIFFIAAKIFPARIGWSI